MAEGWKERLKDALAEMMREEYTLDCVEVLEFEDDTESSGFCDTCYYEQAVVRVKYIDSDGDTQFYTYRGSFSELMGSL